MQHVYPTAQSAQALQAYDNPETRSATSISVKNAASIALNALLVVSIAICAPLIQLVLLNEADIAYISSMYGVAPFASASVANGIALMLCGLFLATAFARILSSRLLSPLFPELFAQHGIARAETALFWISTVALSANVCAHLVATAVQWILSQAVASDPASAAEIDPRTLLTVCLAFGAVCLIAAGALYSWKIRPRSPLVRWVGLTLFASFAVYAVPALVALAAAGVYAAIALIMGILIIVVFVKLLPWLFLFAAVSK